MKRAFVLAIVCAACADESSMPSPKDMTSPRDDAAAAAELSDASRLPASDGVDAAVPVDAYVAVDDASALERDARAEEHDAALPGDSAVPVAPKVLYAIQRTWESAIKSSDYYTVRLSFNADRFPPTDLLPLGDCYEVVDSPLWPVGWSGTAVLDLTAQARACFRQANKTCAYKMLFEWMRCAQPTGCATYGVGPVWDDYTPGCAGLQLPEQFSIRLHASISIDKIDETWEITTP